MNTEPTSAPSMRPEVAPLIEEQAPEPAPEYRARQGGTEARSHAQLVHAVDRLWRAVAASDSLDTLLAELLDVLIDIARVEVAVVRLREGDRLRSRAAIGLDEEVTSGFSVSLDASLAARVSNERAALVFPVGLLDEWHSSELIRHRGVRTLWCLPLYDKDLLGEVCLGAFGPHELSTEDRQQLGVIATHAATAIGLLTALKALERAVQCRDDVLSVVAHDLRNPLNVVTVAAGALLRQLADPSARRLVDRIVRGAERVERLLRDLLEVAAIDAGRLSVERRWIEPADLILSALESQQSLDANACIIFASDLSPDLPPIHADEGRLLEVLENLIGNALKFTEPGGSITIGATHQDGEIVVSVKDSGSGISPEELPHIFDRFWQARKPLRHGTGLGLGIAKAIVEAHGGRIWAESTVGVGTTIRFTIPASPVRPGHLEATCDVATILLVDDRPENLLSLKTILERPDYRVITASSGEEALRLALRESVTVALVDIAMPGMNGFEVALHLKGLERSRDIPIIFVTAFGEDPEEIHRAYAAGGADYLVKPLAAEIVRKKVAVFVELRRRRHQSAYRRAGGVTHDD